MANVLNVAERQWRRYIRARDAGHMDYITRLEKFQNYYSGEQWEEAVRNKLEAEGRPVLTINLILSTINAALGEYSNRQGRIHYKSKRGGSHEASQALTKLAMHVLDENDYDSIEWDMVVDGFVADRGYLDVRIDFDEHMTGNVVITAIDPGEIVLDPDAKEYDPDTWTEVTRTYWATLDEIERDYGPEKREEVEAVAAAGTYYTYDSFDFERRSFGDVEYGNREYDFGDNGERNIKNVRLISRQYRKLAKTWFLVDPQTGDMGQCPQHWDEAERTHFSQMMGLMLHSKPATKVRWTVTCDHVVLHDDWSPYRSFTTIPFFPYFMRGRAFGMTKNLIGSQDYLNKITSQELHVVNTTANSGWTAEEGTLVNMTEDELEERGAETGLVLIHARGSMPPQKIKPNQIPTGLELMSNKSRQYLREISGMEGVLGIASPEISGVALEGKQDRANIQLQVPFTNLNRTRRLLGRKLLELFQAFYTEHRVIEITRDRAIPGEPHMEEVEINAPQDDGTIAYDITQGKYDCSISVQPGRDTFDEMQFGEIMQMRQAGIMIPDHVAVRYSKLAEREELAADLERLAGMAEPTEQELEIMQMQQELQIETAKAELDKLQTEAMEIQSRAELNMAKATQQGGGMEAPENQLRLQELEAKIQMKREELMTRLQLAKLTHQAGQQKQVVQMATQLAQSQHQGEVQRQLAMINTQGRQQGGR